MTLQTMRAVGVTITLPSPTHSFLHSFTKRLPSSRVPGITGSRTETAPFFWGGDKKKKQKNRKIVTSGSDNMLGGKIKPRL